MGALYKAISDDFLDVEKYNELIEKFFHKDGIEFMGGEVYNYFVYEDESSIRSKFVTEILIKLINKDVSFIALDPKRLSILIIKTRDSEAIKSLLNQLFIRNRENLWNSYDTIIAISYLIQRQFMHTDLIDVLGMRNNLLKFYYNNFCINSFLKLFDNKVRNNIIDIIGSDWKMYFFYFMYIVEKNKNNTLSKFAFFKNFFDRMTARFDYYVNPKKRPGYKNFFKEKVLKSFYSKINGSAKIIEDAHILRNSNPISHASGELIDKDTSSYEIDNNIKDLFGLLRRYLKLCFQNKY